MKEWSRFSIWYCTQVIISWKTKVGCVFRIVIWSESRMRQYRDDYHQEDALHFTIIYIILRFNLFQFLYLDSGPSAGWLATAWLLVIDNNLEKHQFCHLLAHLKINFAWVVDGNVGGLTVNTWRLNILNFFLTMIRYGWFMIVRLFHKWIWLNQLIWIDWVHLTKNICFSTIILKYI